MNGKLLPQRAGGARFRSELNTGGAQHTPTVVPFHADTPRSEEKLARRFYALGRNAAATTEGELAVLVAASEGAEVEGAYFTAAVNWGLEAVGCPIRSRGFIDILVEMAAEDTHGRQATDWFSAADVSIGRRARLEPTPPLPPTVTTA